MGKIKKNKIIFICILGVIFIIGLGSVVYFSIKNNKLGDIESYIEGNENNNNLNETEKDSSDSNSINDSEKTENNKDINEKKEEAIYIHIIGEVKNEGLIELIEGNRIVDAIEKAGGVTEYADLSKVNLAFVLSDGQKVRIPSIYDKDDNTSYITDESGKNVIVDNGNPENGNSKSGKININVASQSELETLDGVGPSLAARIIEYRNNKGGFKKIEELKNVSGIGESKFEGLKGKVVVK